MKMLEFLCKKNNITYTSIANKLNITPQTVSKWGKGVKSIPKKYHEQLASMLHVSVEEVHKDINIESEPSTSVEEELIINSILNNNFKIALQPCSDERAQDNYKITIEHSIDTILLKGIVTNKEYETIKEIYSKGKFNVWGVRDGIQPNSKSTLKQYNKLSVGDLVLFYRNKEFVSMGLVTYKTKSKELSNLFWKSDDFKNIYFLDSIFPCNIPVKELNKIYYNKDNDDKVQGFRVLNTEGSQNLAKGLQLTDFIENSSFKGSKDELKDKLDKLQQLAKKGDLNVESDSYSRAEQSLLRSYMLGEKIYHHCALCGQLFHSSEIVAAHIKKRKYCSLNEKVDTYIVMPACKFGCDHLYEYGFIVIDEKGKIQSNKLLSKRVTSFVGKKIGDIEGRTCLYWEKGKTSNYFSWHRQFHLKKM